MTDWVVHFKKQPCDVYTGRPSAYVPAGTPGVDGRWGNPFQIEKDEHRKEIPGSREQVIKQHRAWLLSDKEIWYEKPLRSNLQVIRQLPELKGKILGCWCSPEPCHGDTLARLANSILIPEDLEAWLQEEKKKIKPLPSWYFKSGSPPKPRMKEQIKPWV